MKRALVGCWLLALAGNAQAHRLDEYLQATRVLVATNHVDLFIDLTPGVAVLDQLLPVIDKDRDGRVSEKEATAYAQRVLKDFRVVLDDKVLALDLTNASFPELQRIKEGLGVIRIKATASIELLAAGRHSFRLTNAHLPAISVYLVNALAPRDEAIKLNKQTRDELQTKYRLDFSVHRSPP